MGKAEKIVVLSIIFLVVVLFVWSLGGETGAAEKKSGEDTKVADVEMQEGSFARRAPSAAPETAPDESTDAGEFIQPSLEDGQIVTTRPRDVNEETIAAFEDVPEPVQALSVRMRPGWDIVSTEGLEPTIDPDTLQYRTADGQTWESIADAVYGDATKAILLRHNNEGMEAPGEVVLVPARAEAIEELSQRLAVVRQGESLWGVARRTLGKGSRWREIFEANRGVIADPDYVAPGTELMIPVQ